MEPQRNYGIDLLRIISMFMVVVLHVLGQGGILANTPPQSVNYWVAWTLKVATYCAVNCFALISGFVMWKSSSFKLSKLLRLWLQVAFYTISIFIIFAIVDPESIGLKQAVAAFLPISMKQYWYMTAYFIMYLCTPLLNKAVQKLPRKVLRNILLIIFMVVAALAIMWHKNGYSALWLIVLYVTGGYFAKYEIYKKFTGWKNTIWFAVAVGVTVLSKALIMSYADGKISDLALISYLSPTIVICATALLFLCANLKMSKSAVRLVSFWSPAALGVYIIHVNPLIWGRVEGLTAFLADKSPVVMAGAVLLIAVGVYAVCSMIELGRIYLFKAAEKKFTKSP